MKIKLTVSQFLLLGLALAGSFLNSGCVVGRRTVELPITTMGGAAPAKGEIALGTITDGRHFENKPVDPATPSIDGDVNTLSAAERATFIGRQRNGFGHAMGDIILPANDSVTRRARLLFEEGLRRRGYKVGGSAGGADSIDVTINEFWAWFTPGFATITFESKIRCDVSYKHADKVTNFVVEGHGENLGQIASDANWQLAYSRAFDEFQVNLGRELEKAGL